MSRMPKLPPPPLGYIERVDSEGNPYYAKLPEQVERENQQVLLQKLQTENAALSEQLAQSDEAAITLYESQAATDEAILAIYEKIGGTTA